MFKYNKMNFLSTNRQWMEIIKTIIWCLLISILLFWFIWNSLITSVFAVEKNTVETAQENKTIPDAEAESAKEEKEGDTLAKMNAVNSMSADNQKMLEKAGNLMSMGTKYLMMPALAVLG